MSKFDWDTEKGNWICPKCGGIAKESNYREDLYDNGYADITCTVCGYVKHRVCIFESEN